MSQQSSEPVTWVSVAAAATARGCTRPVIMRAAITGEIRTRVRPGRPVEVALEDARHVELVHRGRRTPQPV